MIEIMAPGPLTTVQDLGRPGYGSWGLVACGAADRRSLRLANRLVGNAEHAAGLEITLGPFRACFRTAATIALTGAVCPITVNGRQEALNTPIRVPEGAELDLGGTVRGLRTYLAVRGGVDVAPVLGSRSSDLAAKIGPAPLDTGTTVPIGTDTVSMPHVDFAPVRDIPEVLDLTVLPGPRDEMFVPDALRTLTATPYTVTPDCDRVGVRLTGAPLHRYDQAELPSEGVIPGAIEVPPNGQPIVFLVDHLTTCGYPVIAVVDEGCLDLLAQARPGQQVRFHLVAATRFF